MKKPNYKPLKCPTCHQTTTYILAIDPGTVHILKQVALFIGKKGINIVHPRKEMEGRYLTSNQVGNLTRARSHGLIARIKGNPGNYCLTTKGAAFLHGSPINRFAILSKAEKHQIGYLDEGIETCVISDFNNPAEPYWEGINYDIEEGRVVVRPQDINHKLL